MKKRRSTRYLLGVALFSSLLVACSGPAIPHAVEGQGDCLACHAQGEQEAPRIPADHTGLPKDRCLTCHEAQ